MTRVYPLAATRNVALRHPGPMDDYLSALVEQAEAVLGDALVGVYVGGSVALNGYRQGPSDIDVAIVVDSSLSDLTKHALVARLKHEALPCPARGLELVVYRSDVAASGTSSPGFELELNTGREMEFRATYHPEDRPSEDGLFWYAVDRSILREHGIALVGPPPDEVFGEVTGLRAVLADSVRWHLAHAPTAGALGALRAMHRVHTGRWISKVEAARNVQEDALRQLD